MSPPIIKLNNTKIMVDVYTAFAIILLAIIVFVSMTPPTREGLVATDESMRKMFVDTYNVVDNGMHGLEKMNRATTFTEDGKLATDSIMFQKTGSTNTDPYSLRKIIHGRDKSSMRLTINDNPNEVFEIWGDSCRNGGCQGEGVVAHKFTADGKAWHKGGLTAGKVDAGKLQTDSIVFQKPGSSSNTDPYSLRKIIHGRDKSSMRLTINDNPNEVFEIWGDSCRNGGCKGAGAVAHKFTATGDTWHKGGLTAGKVEARTANVKGAITAGKVEAWTVDGKGAVRGGRVEAGGGSILTGNSLKTNGKVQKGRMHFLVDENLYICPKGAGTVFNTFNGGNPKIMMQSGGKGKHHAAIKMDGTSITGDFGGGTGRMHVSGKGDLLVLKEKGLHVGHWWGGEPIVNISSGGGKTGKFCIDNICISKEDLKKIKILK